MNTNDNNLEIAAQDKQEENKLQTWTKPGFEQMDLKEAMTVVNAGGTADIGLYS